MAIKTPAQILAESDATYFDNTSGSITPTSVRALNTDWIDSVLFITSLPMSTVGTASLAIRALTANTATSSLNADNATNATNATNAVFASAASTAASAVTASYVGNAIVTASVAASTITFTKGDATTFNITVAQSGSVATASYSLFAEAAATASFYGGSVVSASFANTASFARSSSRAEVAGVAAIATLATSASYAISSTSSSYASNAELVDGFDALSFVLTSSFNTFSGSVSSRLTNAASLTGTNTFSGVNIFNNSVTASNVLITSASVLNLLVQYETASVIYSSGSNQFGDAANDIQTLWGQVDVKSGPVTVTGSVNASAGFVGNLTGTSSWATTATVAIQALTATSATSASFASTANLALLANQATTAATASSVGVLGQNVTITGSLSMTGLSPINVSHVKANDIQGVEILTNTGTTVATFGAGGGTGVTVVGQVNAASFAGSGSGIVGVVSSSFATRANSLNALSQSLVITGSFNGLVVSSSLSSQTASFNFNTANFFTSLVTGSTRFEITNPAPGDTVNVLLTTQGAGQATASFSSNVKQVSGSSYVPTSGDAKQDILTFISFDGTSVYLANVKNLI